MGSTGWRRLAWISSKATIPTGSPNGYVESFTNGKLYWASRRRSSTRLTGAQTSSPRTASLRELRGFWDLTSEYDETARPRAQGSTKPGLGARDGPSRSGGDGHSRPAAHARRLQAR